MSKVLAVLFVFAAFSTTGGNDPQRRKDSLADKGIAQARLHQLIDSVLELDHPSAADLAMLAQYAAASGEELPEKKHSFNLNDLSFYSASDETVLFPLTSLDSLPATFELPVESDYLSYFFLPVRGPVTSNFGWRDGRIHKGIDIDLKKGEAVATVFDGKVRVARYQGGFGNVVIVMHPNGLETVYAHLSRIKVKVGDIVLSGQTIGLGGSTGRSSGSHLHFEIHYKGHALNPGAVISFNAHQLYCSSLRIRNTGKQLLAFPSNCSLHSVKRGDSWYSIAQQYGLSLKQLMVLNGVDRRYVLRAGQELRVN